jgi:hypothetical protein
VGFVVGFVVDVLVVINEFRIFVWTWAGELAELRDQLCARVWQAPT